MIRTELLRVTVVFSERSRESAIEDDIRGDYDIEITVRDRVAGTEKFTSVTPIAREFLEDSAAFLDYLGYVFNRTERAYREAYSARHQG